MDKQRVNQWYDEYSQDIYQYALYLLRHEELAKDILQDTFLKAYKNIHQYKEENTKGWLFTIARNLCLDHIRKKHPINYMMDTVPHSSKTPEQSLHTSETVKELYAALGNLKRSYREVIILRKIKEFSVTETAMILNWNEAKVRTTLSRAIQALKKRLEMEGYEHETL